MCLGDLELSRSKLESRQCHVARVFSGSDYYAYFALDIYASLNYISLITYSKIIYPTRKSSLGNQYDLMSVDFAG